MVTFDRAVALITLLVAAAAALAAWYPYRWAREQRGKQAEAERRFATLMNRLRANADFTEWEVVDPADEDAIALGFQRGILMRGIDERGRSLVRRKID